MKLSIPKFGKLTRKAGITAERVVLVMFLMLVGGAAFAGTTGDAAVGGSELGEIYEWFKGLVQGMGGRIVALLIIFIGVIMGIARGSIFAFVTGFATAILFYFAPDIIESMTGATIILG